MLHRWGLKDSLLPGSICGHSRRCRSLSSSLLLLLSYKSVRRNTAFYDEWANKKLFPMPLFLIVWGYLWVGGVFMRIGRLFLLCFQYKLGHISPVGFPFFYWSEEMKRKERQTNNQTKKAALVCLCLSLKTCMCVLREGKLRIISRQLIIPYQTSLERSYEMNCLCHPLPVVFSLQFSGSCRDLFWNTHIPRWYLPEGCLFPCAAIFLRILWTRGVKAMLCWKHRFQGEFPYTMDCI